MTGRIPNGATHLIDGQVSCKGGKPSELKHLISWRKRKQKVIPLVVASVIVDASRMFWKEQPKEVTVLYTKS